MFRVARDPLHIHNLKIFTIWHEKIAGLFLPSLRRTYCTSFVPFAPMPASVLSSLLGIPSRSQPLYVSRDKFLTQPCSAGIRSLFTLCLVVPDFVSIARRGINRAFPAIARTRVRKTLNVRLVSMQQYFAKRERERERERERGAQFISERSI